MVISEAYAVLGTPAKRAAYDRDVLRLHHSTHSSHPSSHRGTSHHGSYHSTGPAGGRPASGLSRRRGTFRGPPPSFYRSGGWGTQSEKRKAAHEESTGGGGGAAFRERGGDATSSGAGTATGAATETAGGMGPGQDPFGHQGHVSHFDREAHTRTHARQDQRRAWRMRSLGEEGTYGQSMLVDFLVVTGILTFGLVTPALVLGLFRDKKVKEKR
jgi:curved DNA-binding protein CbpA